jgi:pyruvate/2-oxoglutarate dehydrogenase complex dihydrolipoamide acyltransferase (E2) component
MNVNMKMPDLATNAGTELGIARWIVEVGHPVKRGQAILEVETDKAVQEVECIATGVLQAIHVPAGEKVAVGTIIATITVGSR